VPQIFLPDNQSLIDAGTTKYDYHEEKNDLTDDQIRTIITERTQTIAKTLAPTYQTLIPQVVENIMKAEEYQTIDPFLATFGSAFLEQPDREMYQDYTQFKPRSHYTDSSLLKTYFIAMKWLMREKFYFQSPPLTKAALVLVNTIDAADLLQLNQLSEQIFNLIGTDDDLTLDGLRAYSQEKKLTTPTDIIANLDETIMQELVALQPQKIQSTNYKTPNNYESVEEEDAKAMTNGFVFFGEKFTLDSYLFDLTTAGSAEKEFAYKPNIQTALIVPDILEDNALANQLVKLRLAEKAETEQVLENPNYTQLSSYDTVRTEAKTALAFSGNNSPELNPAELLGSDTNSLAFFTNNIYHKRLNMLGLLLKAPLENAPYFRLDPLYALKNLMTYMGSYTELKHDTLLYVKQSYAEMGAGGEGECRIRIETPALPVPKGYLEAEPAFIDQLIQLNTETLPYFTGTYERHKFIEFGTILERFKAISIQQMHNEVISDEDFERLRLLGTQLNQLVLPTKPIGQPSQKELRG
jgi:hypothetical protein